MAEGDVVVAEVVLVVDDVDVVDEVAFGMVVDGTVELGSGTSVVVVVDADVVAVVGGVVVEVLGGSAAMTALCQAASADRCDGPIRRRKDYRKETSGSRRSPERRRTYRKSFRKETGVTSRKPSGRKRGNRRFPTGSRALSLPRSSAGLARKRFRKEAGTVAGCPAQQTPIRPPRRRSSSG